MKKKVVSILLAAMVAVTTTFSAAAMTEDELREDQAWNYMQLDAINAQINQLWAAKQQMDAQIEQMNSDLVNIMVSIDILKSDIASKQKEIEDISANLVRAQNARDEQYESMKERIRYLYENGGDDAWIQMILNTDDISKILTRAEYTQSMYDQDRKALETYVNTIEEVKTLQTRYESEKAQLEEMELALEEQSQQLQYQIEVCQSTSSDYANEIAYSEQMAAEYESIIWQEQAMIEQLESERIAYEIAMQEEAEAEMRAAYEDAVAEDYDLEDNEDGVYDEGEIYASDDYGNVYDVYGNLLVDGDEVMETIENAAAESYEETYDVGEPEYEEVYDEELGEYTYVPVETTDYDYEEDYSESSSSYSSTGSAIADFATQFVGNPYVWGGTSLTNGADCSGFVQSVYANYGIDLPRTSYDQMYAGTEVSYADAQAGDLICYGGHVAIYLGDGKIVHASNSVDGIKISDDATYRTILSVRRLT